MRHRRDQPTPRMRFNRTWCYLVGCDPRYPRHTYTPPGGRVSVRAVSEPPDAVVRIEDTGMGIGPDVLPKVFELFTRSGAAAAAASDGLGIGLAVAKQIVELHGGSIEARSPGVGKGAVFSVRVPSTPSSINST